MSAARALLALVVALAPAAAVGLEPGESAASLVPEHGKALTADATPVDPGVVEVEFGYAPTWCFHRPSAGDHRDEQTHAFVAALTFGAAPHLDVRFSGGFGAVVETGALPSPGGARAGAQLGAGLVDAVLGARFRFLHLPRQGLDVAVVAETALPTGTPRVTPQLSLTQEFWSARGALVATQDFGALSASAEVAYALPVFSAGAAALVQANLAVGYQVLSWLQPELELNFQAVPGEEAGVLFATAGVVAPFGANERLVAAVQQPVWPSSSAYVTAAVLAFKTAL